jgi:glycosyltransferase involved in cell wall biosynthesis
VSRPAVAFVAWTATPGRAVDIAEALGGEARPFNALGLVDRRLIPVRYLIDSLRTAWYLARRRPRAVIATHPPLFPGLIAYAYARLARAPFVLDSHISAFGLMNDRLSELMLPVHRWLAPRAAAVLVTDDELGAIARSWGARPAIVHEPPLAWPVAPAGPLRERPRVLFAGTFQRDEPVAEVMEAARELPGLDVHMTGDLRRCPPDLRASAPPNVTLVGFLPGAEFARAIEEADVVLSLSTERVSVMRTAYEAVYAGRPLVVPDRPLMRSVFPYAVYVDVAPGAIAAGLRDAVARHAELVQAAAAARDLQWERWRAQLAELRAVLS